MAQIPIDPLYLSWKLKTFNYTARFIELASEINTGMPRYWVRKVQEALNDDTKALRGSSVPVRLLAATATRARARAHPHTSWGAPVACVVYSSPPLTWPVLAFQYAPSNAAHACLSAVSHSFLRALPLRELDVPSFHR